MSQSLQCYCPTNTLPDPVPEAIFLAQCFENLFYPPNCQFPFSLSVVFQLLSWNFSLLLSKHQCYPAGSPPTFSPTIAHVPFCCLCWKELPTCIQNASFSSTKPFWATTFTFTPVTNFRQRSGHASGVGRKHSLFCQAVTLDCFPVSTLIYN